MPFVPINCLLSLMRSRPLRVVSLILWIKHSILQGGQVPLRVEVTMPQPSFGPVLRRQSVNVRHICAVDILSFAYLG